MENSKLLELLRTFKARDLRRLEQYLASPLFNSQEKLQHFFGVVRDTGPEFAGKAVEKAAIWKKYAPNEPYDEKEMGYLMSFLAQAAENYIALDRFEREPMAAHTFRMEYFLNNGLEKHYRAEQRKAEKCLEEAPYRDSDWADQAWRLSKMEVSSFYRNHSRTIDTRIQQASAHLDAYYFAEKLILSCELLNQQSILSAEVNPEMVKEWAEFLTVHAPTSNPEIQLRLCILQILQDPSDKATFQQLLRLMPGTPSFLPSEKVRGVYLYAQNHCIRQIKNGNTAYLNEMFEISRQSIEIGLIYDHDSDQINPWNFKNIVSTALKLGHYDWTEQFIQKYQEGLPPEFRQSAIAYNMAHLNFHRKQYEKALKSLLDVEFSDIFYALDTRKLQLMIYFERQDAEPLLSLISSFKVFLRRNNLISASNRQAYKNFVDWVARIFRETEKNNPQLAQFIPLIHQTTPLVDADWLEKQCS